MKPGVFRLQLPPRPRHHGALEQARRFETVEAVRRLFKVCTIMMFCGFSKRNKQVMKAQRAKATVMISSGVVYIGPANGQAAECGRSLTSCPVKLIAYV